MQPSIFLPEASLNIVARLERYVHTTIGITVACLIAISTAILHAILVAVLASPVVCLAIVLLLDVVSGGDEVLARKFLEVSQLACDAGSSLSLPPSTLPWASTTR